MPFRITGNTTTDTSNQRSEPLVQRSFNRFTPSIAGPQAGWGYNPSGYGQQWSPGDAAGTAGAWDAIGGAAQGQDMLTAKLMDAVMGRVGAADDGRIGANLAGMGQQGGMLADFLSQMIGAAVDRDRQNLQWGQSQGDWATRLAEAAAGVDRTNAQGRNDFYTSRENNLASNALGGQTNMLQALLGNQANMTNLAGLESSRAQGQDRVRGDLGQGLLQLLGLDTSTRQQDAASRRDTNAGLLTARDRSNVDFANNTNNALAGYAGQVDTNRTSMQNNDQNAGLQAFLAQLSERGNAAKTKNKTDMINQILPDLLGSLKGGFSGGFGSTLHGGYIPRMVG